MFLTFISAGIDEDVLNPTLTSVVENVSFDTKWESLKKTCKYFLAPGGFELLRVSRRRYPSRLNSQVVPKLCFCFLFLMVHSSLLLFHDAEHVRL